MLPYINIHTHRPTGRGIELRTAGIHPWEADSQDVEAFAARFADKGGRIGTGVAGETTAGTGRVGEGVVRDETAGTGHVGEGVVRDETAGTERVGNEAAEVQAIGETGLDFACPVPREAQFAALRAQLDLARRTGRPVVLHCVRAFEPLMRELAACEPRAVIFHGFIGSPEQAQQALRRGYYLSFGERTFASSKTLRALCETPLGQLFFETDAAGVTIEEIYARAAEALGRPVEELQRATLENYKRLFETQNG
ncbi:TatD family hydrolase [uncultured Alistipes sp.]|uniref:TatD family hydrolase n=1 Tax=uncultured Alistipes sp. TaxID=538949 RepID=UPI00320B0CBE